MKKDKIESIEIDEVGRLLIKPEKERFNLIYRTASEVHWDNNNSVLFSPKPREWSYLDWYKHIIKIAKEECLCGLYLTKETKWINIPREIKSSIENLK